MVLLCNISKFGLQDVGFTVVSYLINKFHIAYCLLVFVRHAFSVLSCVCIVLKCMESYTNAIFTGCIKLSPSNACGYMGGIGWAMPKFGRGPILGYLVIA